MRSKIIQGDFEDPPWLSLGEYHLCKTSLGHSALFSESRDLIKNILVKDVTKRFMIPQILAHPWFTARKLTYEPESPVSAAPLFSISDRPSTPPGDESRRSSHGTAPDSSEASHDSLSPLTNPHSELGSSTPTTPDESMSDPFESTDNNAKNESSIHRFPSSSTIRKHSTSDLESLSSRLAKAHPATVMEEEQVRYSPSPLMWSSTKPPPSHPIRTPARTKRRSVSSILSENASPTNDKTPTPLPIPTARDLDFASLLSARTPVIFSTTTERHLLNTLALLGFDTAQIVHSVLTNACDAAGSLWWMLRKKEKDEKTFLEHDSAVLVASPVGDADESSLDTPLLNDAEQTKLKTPSGRKRRHKTSVAIQTTPPSPSQLRVVNTPARPKFSLVPPTPTFTRPATPPRNVSPTPRSPLLSPSTSTMTGDSGRSHPSTPSGSLRDRDASSSGSKGGRKPRAGSVSIMQRATTALEAAGLVRKKSTEAVREEKEKERDREKSKETERDRRGASGDEPRSSHGSGGSSKLTKSPPLKPAKEHVPPATPPPSEQSHAGLTATQMGSPWVLADRREALSQPHQQVPPPIPSAISAVNVKGEMLYSHSTPNFSEGSPAASGLNKVNATGPMPRNRPNFMAQLRHWFNEDRKSKRKDSSAGAGNPANVLNTSRTHSSSGRRGSGASNGKFGSTRGTNAHWTRPSMSSRRSSSVNSRRSSGTSVQMMVLESPQIPTRRSFGSHTPNSERGDHSSRPSSIRSISIQPRHRKSPSQSSAGSIHLRTSSPMQKFHRRGGSNSSSTTTRVVRQTVGRPPHARSNSAASSIHSPPSSRPTSFYEPSEGEGLPRTASPFKSRSRRTADDSSRRLGGATFVAQKRQGPFMSPAVGRSSWKKSWGMEPPGWSSRTTHLPIEVLAISPPNNEPMSIRDVFSGKQTYHASAGDESDWVDEDDDIPAFAGGLGQLGTSVSLSSGGGFLSSHSSMVQMEPVTLSPAPRGHRNGGGKRANRNTGGPSLSSSGSGSSGVGSGGGVVGGRQTAGGHSPAQRVSPLPTDTGYDSSETRAGRRQLPATRSSGPAFKHAIQEEDEGEEE